MDASHPTPPECVNRKPSVSFILPDTATEPAPPHAPMQRHPSPPPPPSALDADDPAEANEALPARSLAVNTDSLPLDEPAKSPQIPAQILPDEICVALLEREVEMRELMQANPDFFDLLKHSLSEEDWERLQRVLLAPREAVNDVQWVQRVKELLVSSPAYYQKFKLLVGYEEEEEEEEEEKEDETDASEKMKGGEAELHDEGIRREQWEKEPSKALAARMGEFRLADIRRYPFKLAFFERAYPQFWINARRCLDLNVSPQKDEKSETAVEDTQKEGEAYRKFKQTFFAPKDVLDSDDEWEQRIVECLEDAPNLLAQLADIVQYEVSGDTPFDEIPKEMKKLGTV
ncbi:uncharacterized protein VTP21DRAFT_171 [Calcarisporiella thermophila]|uniref:uncharacterized protein n=1 Tax=Calcarisporiella thermophila TaxID=911321 RepID=UPI0037428E4B